MMTTCYITQVQHHTHIDMLHVVCLLLKHMMISTQVRHHTHFDVTTCRVCFVKHMMIMRQYFPRLWYDPYQLYTRTHFSPLWFCSLLCIHVSGSLSFLVRWSVICCQDGCLTAFAKGALPKEYLSHNFETMLGRTLGLFDAFPTLVGGHH